MADTFVVVGQEQTMGKLPDGTYGQVVRVSFRTQDASVHAIDVPLAAYNVATVRALIEERVATSDQISTL